MTNPASTTDNTTIAAGVLAPWETGDLPAPPRPGWRLWVGLLGPGVVLAGTSIGTGEWLFGPAVSAQYGAALFWLALTSILLQGFCNLMFMRYAVYCGEPIIVGILRTRPGPTFWMIFFAILELPGLLPYNASNAAVPLAAAVIGHLPQTAGDQLLVKALGIATFLLAFLPLIFGGTVYRMLEKIMTAKLVVVLGYLSVIAVTMVSAPVVWDVLTGFVRFGTVPLRPDTLIVGRHFTVTDFEGTTRYMAKGTWERDGNVSGDLLVTRGSTATKHGLRDGSKLPAELVPVRDRLLKFVRPFADYPIFYLEVADRDHTLIAQGTVVENHYWEAENFIIVHDGNRQDYGWLDDVPEPFRAKFKNYLDHEGLAYVSLVGYVRENGRAPPLDWAVVVAFIAIAGAGGLTNSMFSNYARDKGWGMGAHVGAIPSAFGGVTIGLSHTGRVFPIDEANRSRWRGWMRHIFRDQLLWMAASVVGMALPCMMSLEFIRNATVTEHRVAAMSAEGIASRFPAQAGLFWFLTLFCGFLVLAPGQVSVGDQIARRWTDMIWTAGKRLKRLSRGDVRTVYYGILAGYGVIGLVILTLLPPVKIATISSVLQNIALGSSSLLSLYVNRRLLPKELQPGWFHQLGVILCGVFFLGISAALLLLL
jgi:hypothetical protein